MRVGVGAPGRRVRRSASSARPTSIAGLQSPHTVYLYDFGVSQDGRFYYVMELLDGISLQTLVTTFGPQPAGARGCTSCARSASRSRRRTSRGWCTAI